jgi:putative tryptophan/tyrosine transport system substrate-binding protein
MRRREFVAILGGVAFGLPIIARAQRAAKLVIGFLRAGRPPNRWLEAFRQGLSERGYVDGQNVVIELRFTDGNVDELPQLAKELVLKVDIILASGGPPALAAKNATTSLPIVFAGVTNPVEIGLVSSLGRPEGNVTGLAVTAGDLAGKRLELLKELIPRLSRVAVLWDGTNPTNATQYEVAEVAGRDLGLQLEPVTVRDSNGFDAAFDTVRRVDGLLELDSPLFTTHRAQLIALASRTHLPVIYGPREAVEAGGLISYGPDYADVYRRAATYVDKIFKGATPADLPVEQPTKIELVINLKTAKTLGLRVPESILLRADEVIE